MLKNSKIILSNLNTCKCSLNFYQTITPQLQNAKSIIRFIISFTTTVSEELRLLRKKKINAAGGVSFSIASFSATQTSWFFFEPLEQFEIVNVFSDSKLLSIYAAIPFFNYAVPLVFGCFFYFILFANLPVYSNIFIANVLLFKLVKNLFSVNVPNFSKNQNAFFLFYTVFMFILYHNLSGMAPFTYTVTSLIITTFLLSITVFFYVCVKSILQNGWFFFDHFLPEGVNIRGARWMVIIEIISFFTRVISLGVRLFANLLSGHILLKVLIGFFLIGITSFNDSGWLLFPGLLAYFAVLVLVTLLEVFISFLQAYTFVFLAIIYFGETTKVSESTAANFKEKIFFFKPNLFSDLKTFFFSKNFPAFLVLFFNAPKPKQRMFQEAGSHMMEAVISFHNDVMCFLIFIVVAIVYLIGSCIYYFHFKKDDPAVIEYMQKYNTTHNATLEIIWTAFPTIVLLSIVLPSFVLLYISSGRLDTLSSPLVIKVVAHQWYWTYEYAFDILYDSSGTNDACVFDSYLVPVSDLHFGATRLLESTGALVIPTHTKIRFIITSTDVIHSWAVPGLGIKVDACPGRINEVTTIAKRQGIYLGQCSEICGTNHSFMPTHVVAVHPADFYYDSSFTSYDYHCSDCEEVHETLVVDPDFGARILEEDPDSFEDEYSVMLGLLELLESEDDAAAAHEEETISTSVAEDEVVDDDDLYED